MNTYFNDYLSDWNFNHSVVRSGFSETKPEICPFFFIKKAEFHKNSNIYKYLMVLSEFCWNLSDDSVNSSHKSLVSNFISQRDLSKLPRKEFFLFPIGMRRVSRKTSDINFTLGFLEGVQSVRDGLTDVSDDKYENILLEIFSAVRELVDYIYIPTEMDYEKFTKIEGGTIQALMGSTIEDEVKSMVGGDVVRRINKNLDGFLNSVEHHLQKYKYQKPAQRQVLFNSSHLASKIIEVYFDSRVLNLKGDKGLVPVVNFSSGEKRKALIDIAEAFILKARKPDNKKKVIFALDEPEVSLHLSACFEQFSKLENISRKGIQVLVTSHWYGFFPSVSNGVAIFIGVKKGVRESYLIRLSRYREDIQYIQQEKKADCALTVELKSMNDTVQSVLSSILSTDAKWIVCEGYSDKIYLSHFFPDRNVISMGKGKNVKRFYDYLVLALADNQTEVIGKVLFLLDTDKNFEMGSHKDSVKGVRIRRLQNSVEGCSTELKKTSDNSHYPPTEIEDVLDAFVFYETLVSVIRREGCDIGFEVRVGDCESKLVPSGLAFDLRDSERETLRKLFDIEGMKVLFAERYCEMDRKVRQPSWVEKISSDF